MLWKPWIFDGIDYASMFWTYANECPFADDIKKSYNSMTDEIRENKSLVFLVESLISP